MLTMRPAAPQLSVAGGSHFSSEHKKQRGDMAQAWELLARARLKHLTERLGQAEK
jgi:hypothetical protein